MATSTKLLVALETADPSLGGAAQENSMVASTAWSISLDSLEVPSTSCPESLNPTKTFEAKPARAKTSDPSDAKETPMAVSVAPITPDSPTLDHVFPFKTPDDTNTVTAQDVSQETPDSPATPSSSLGAPVTVTVHVKPYESPKPSPGCQSSDSPESCSNSSSVSSSTSSYSISAEEMESAKAKLMLSTTKGFPLWNMGSKSNSDGDGLRSSLL